MPEEKLARVVGMASSLPLEPQDPRSPSNRRISILVMTKEAEERLLGGPVLEVPLEVEAKSGP
jgi:chemotaxis protein MotB